VRRRFRISDNACYCEKCKTIKSINCFNIEDDYCKKCMELMDE